jgi:hypothetical protein
MLHAHGRADVRRRVCACNPQRARLAAAPALTWLRSRLRERLEPLPLEKLSSAWESSCASLAAAGAELPTSSRSLELDLCDAEEFSCATRAG